MAGTREKALQNLSKGIKTGRRPEVMRKLLNDLAWVREQAELGMEMEDILKDKEVPRKNWDQIMQNESFITAFDSGRAKLKRWNLEKGREMIGNGESGVLNKYLGNYNDFSDKPVQMPSKVIVKLPDDMRPKRNSGKGKKTLKLVTNASN